ncbi:MAG: hypothetical protein Q7J75_00800 [Rhodoferax sp.]|nr:hypothetical protein [Rhodoferax sp.]
MSVINKMLRDLDSRQVAGTMPVQHQEPRTGIVRGTSIVIDPHKAVRRPSRAVVAFLASIAFLGSGAAGWWLMGASRTFETHAVSVAPSPTVVSPAVLPVVAPAPASAVSTAPDERVVDRVTSPPPAANVETAPLSATTLMPTPAIVPKPMVAGANAAPADMSLKMDAHLNGATSPDLLARPGVVTTLRSAPEKLSTERPVALSANTAVAAVPLNPARQSPALEALGQAQSLWNAGSHEAALELLREALAAAERVHLAAPSAGHNAALAALARELARMELAEGRVSPALEMLTRLEPALTGFADVWAIRGNAAQRLGRYQESASAYLMALRLRPDEPRWMLGAAVSLAAQGNTTGAAEWAEKARAGGVLSREVAVYLKQLGVPLRDR